MAGMAENRPTEHAEDSPLRRPMTSEVNWALLALLVERPGYGAQLKQRFELDFADVVQWGSETHVYTALNELQRRGLIEELPGQHAASSGTRRQPKICYIATEEGISVLLERLCERMTEDRRQARMFARVLAVFVGRPQAALTVLARLENAYLEEGASGSSGTLPRFADRLVREESRLTCEARLPWVHYARQQFEEHLREVGR
jgi:DNA-binding PadR family transcriptional regulator